MMRKKFFKALVLISPLIAAFAENASAMDMQQCQENCRNTFTSTMNACGEKFMAHPTPDSTKARDACDKKAGEDFQQCIRICRGTSVPGGQGRTY